MPSLFVHFNRQNSKLFYGAILVAFVVLAVFGAMIISSHLDGDCLSSLFKAESCPGQTMLSLQHHLSLPHQYASVSLVGIASLLGSILAVALLFRAFVQLPIFNSRPLRIYPVVPVQTVQLNSWLSLFENSPNCA